MMKRSSMVVGAAALLAAARGSRRRPRRASSTCAPAGNAGGMYGWGTTPNTPDFFEQTRGPGFGFEVGAKLLVFDFSVDFMQIVNDGGLSGTLIQVLLGTEHRHPGRASAKLDERPERAACFTPGVVGGRRARHGRARDAAGDNDQLADKGFVSRSARLRVLPEPVHGRRRRSWTSATTTSWAARR